ncbi:MAG: F0F1 ATP synthase subunit B [Lactobacillaceae bacterium]|jgi:F-type H+-transporting ATPase subunit b|nr:F0F1 ATP synthase subunit B [Lactobacillaceae bacterium]
MNTTGIIATTIPEGSALFLLVSFIILLALMKKFVFGPVQDMMDKRAQQINDDLDNAIQTKENALKDQEQIKFNLQESQKQAAELLNNARINAEKESSNLIGIAQARANDINRQARLDANQIKEDALNQAKNEIADLSLKIASQIVNKELNERTHQKLIDDFISEVSSKGK